MLTLAPEFTPPMMQRIHGDLVGDFVEVERDTKAMTKGNTLSSEAKSAFNFF